MLVLVYHNPNNNRAECYHNMVDIYWIIDHFQVQNLVEDKTILCTLKKLL